MMDFASTDFASTDFVSLGLASRERVLEKFQETLKDPIRSMWKMSTDRNIFVSAEDLAEILQGLHVGFMTEVRAAVSNEVRAAVSNNEVRSEVRSTAVSNEVRAAVSNEVRSEVRSAFSNEVLGLLKVMANTMYTQTPTELGSYVKMNADIADNLVPEPVSKATAAKVWNPLKWKTLEKSSTARIFEREFVSMLKDVKEDLCESGISFTGNAQEDGSPLRKLVDFTIHLKGKPPLPCYTTALVSLHSLPEAANPRLPADRKYNSKIHVGHAVSRAISVLKNAGPSRKKVLVAVTNLRKIQWFAVQRASEADQLYQLFKFFKSPEIAEVRESLVAVLLANPADVFVAENLNLAVRSQALVISSFLGLGVTSTVYKCENFFGQAVAMKIFKEKECSDKLCRKERANLEQLQGVPAGVPTFVEAASDGSFLLLSPVGKQVPKEVPKEAKGHWDCIVNSLEGAHSRGLVHRDVRLGNILLAEDFSFILIDWGFACPLEQVSPFYGSLLTASKSILQQYIADKCAVLFQPKDDLVSLVKSLYLRSQPGFERKLRHLKIGLNLPQSSNVSSEACEVLRLWEVELEMCDFWTEAIGLAENLAYEDLKKWIRGWGLNYCP